MRVRAKKIPNIPLVFMFLSVRILFLLFLQHLTVLNDFIKQIFPFGQQKKQSLKLRTDDVASREIKKKLPI